MGPRRPEGYHFEVVDPGELAFHGVGSAHLKQAGDRALLAFPDESADGTGKQLSVRLNIAARAGSLIEPLVSLLVRLIAAEAELLQAVEHLLCLRVRKQDLAIIIDMHNIMRRQRIAMFGYRERRLPHRPQTEDYAGWNRVLPVTESLGDRVGPERQCIEAASDWCADSPQIDAKIVERQVRDGNATGKVSRSITASCNF